MITSKDLHVSKPSLDRDNEILSLRLGLDQLEKRINQIMANSQFDVRRNSMIKGLEDLGIFPDSEKTRAFTPLDRDNEILSLKLRVAQLEKQVNQLLRSHRIPVVRKG